MPTINYEPIPVAAWSKAWECGRWLAGTARSIPAGGARMSVSCECCVLSGLCVGVITHPQESYRLCCVWVCSWSFDQKERPSPDNGPKRDGKKLINKLSLNCQISMFSHRYVWGFRSSGWHYVTDIQDSSVFRQRQLSKNSSATFRPLKMMTPCYLETSGSDTQWHGVMPRKKKGILSFKLKLEQKVAQMSAFA